MRFADLPWDPEVVVGWRRLVAEGRHPVLLVVGEDATPVSIAFIQAWLCQSLEEGDACGRCQSCQYIRRGMSHPDLEVVFPLTSALEKEMQKEGVPAPVAHWQKLFRQYSHGFVPPDLWLTYITQGGGMPVLPANRLRQFLQSVHRLPVVGSYVVGWIWQAQLLGTSGNILLKLLEEPPAHLRIILTASTLSPILPTIRSRTLIVSVPPLSSERVMTYLTTGLRYRVEEVAKVIPWCAGSVTRAVRLLEPEVRQAYSLAREGWELLADESSASWWRWLQAVEQAPRPIQQSIPEWWLLFLRKWMEDEPKAPMHNGGSPAILMYRLVDRLHRAQTALRHHIPSAIVLYLVLRELQQWLPVGWRSVPASSSGALS